MRNSTWKIVLYQLGIIALSSFKNLYPAYGIPPYLWDVKWDGRISQWGTLFNYLEWHRHIK